MIPISPTGSCLVLNRIVFRGKVAAVRLWRSSADNIRFNLTIAARAFP